MKIGYPVINFVVSQEFGGNPGSYAGFGLRGHNGIDFAIPVGSPVWACDDGVVAVSRWDSSGYGELIVVQHAWGKSYYAHLSAREVAAGATVRRGQMIGKTGNTGNSTGPHLHFEIRPDGVSASNGFHGAVDPRGWLEDEASPADNAAPIHAGAKAKVMADVLNVRVGPGTNFLDIGDLFAGGEIEVVDVIEKDGQEWVKIMWPVYVCSRFGKERYIEPAD